jgi:hypothetical protein
MHMQRKRPFTQGIYYSKQREDTALRGGITYDVSTAVGNVPETANKATWWPSFSFHLSASNVKILVPAFYSSISVLLNIFNMSKRNSVTLFTAHQRVYYRKVVFVHADLFPRPGSRITGPSCLCIWWNKQALFTCSIKNQRVNYCVKQSLEFSFCSSRFSVSEGHLMSTSPPVYRVFRNSGTKGRGSKPTVTQQCEQKVLIIMQAFGRYKTWQNNGKCRLYAYKFSEANP